MAPLALEQVAEEIPRSKLKPDKETVTEKVSQVDRLDEVADHQSITNVIIDDETNNRRKRDQECNTRAVMVSMATGVMGFSTGFAVQVSTGRVLPGFVKRKYVVPALFAAYVSSRTYLYLIENCKNSPLIMPKKFNLKSEHENQNDSVVLS